MSKGESKNPPISIHVPRVEDDCYNQSRGEGGRDFNPRPPCGGRHIDCLGFVLTDEFQSTSPVWRTTQIDAPKLDDVIISIHVPRVEDDGTAKGTGEDFTISIHVPRVEDDDLSSPTRTGTK